MNESNEDIINQEVEFEKAELPPEATFQGVCYGVFDLGYVEKKNFNTGEPESKRMILIGFELNKKRTKGTYAGKRFKVGKRFVYTLNEKGTLYGTLKTWLNIKLGQGFKLGTLKGKNAQISISHNNGYANISNIAALMEGVPIMELEDPDYKPSWIDKKESTVKEGKPDYSDAEEYHNDKYRDGTVDNPDDFPYRARIGDPQDF